MHSAMCKGVRIGLKTEFRKKKKKKPNSFNAVGWWVCFSLCRS